LPSFSDDEIFAHTRRIVIAELQNIIYGEFLPLLVGSNGRFNEGNGNSGNSGPDFGQDSKTTFYNPTTDPSIINEFASAAFRFGHTLINGFFLPDGPNRWAILSTVLIEFCPQ
jgi:peroxidase